MSTCIHPNNTIRCANLVTTNGITNTFCDEHLLTSVPLRDAYKDAANVVRKDIEKLHMPKLGKLPLEKLHTIYKTYLKAIAHIYIAIKARNVFELRCVHPSCIDAGHNYYYNIRYQDKLVEYEGKCTTIALVLSAAVEAISSRQTTTPAITTIDDIIIADEHIDSIETTPAPTIAQPLDITELVEANMQYKLEFAIDYAKQLRSSTLLSEKDLYATVVLNVREKLVECSMGVRVSTLLALSLEQLILNYTFLFVNGLMLEHKVRYSSLVCFVDELCTMDAKTTKDYMLVHIKEYGVQDKSGIIRDIIMAAREKHTEHYGTVSKPMANCKLPKYTGNAKNVALLYAQYELEVESNIAEITNSMSAQIFSAIILWSVLGVDAIIHNVLKLTFVAREIGQQGDLEPLVKFFSTSLSLLLDLDSLKLMLTKLTTVTHEDLRKYRLTTEKGHLNHDVRTILRVAKTKKLLV